MDCSDRGQTKVQRRIETDVMVGNLKRDTINDFFSETLFPVPVWKKIFPD
jgi:hypothetical protein